MRTILRLAAAAILLAFATAYADQQVSVQYKMPVQACLNVNETDCDNSPGPWITIDGAILLGDLEMRFIFQNNVKGTHQKIVPETVDVMLVPLGGSITIPKQPVRGGVGGNPHIWLQLLDSDGAALSDEIYLGRCVQGLRVNQDALIDALAAAVIAPAECNNSPGPTITLSGSLTLSGMKAKLIFRNNLKGTHTAVSDEVEIVLFPDNLNIEIPKQPVLGGTGGNPWIWVQFLQGQCDLLGDPVFLGRCVQM